MESRIDSQYFCSIRPGYISTYSIPVESSGRSSLQMENEVNLLENWHNGKISRKSKIKIKNAIDWLTFLSTPKKVFSKRQQRKFSFSLTFITLTLASPQIHDDNTIKRVLFHQFVTELVQKYKPELFVWRAESQANGNIHFHITCNKYIPWWLLRDQWNRIQDKLGYVCRYQQRMLDLHKNGFKLNDKILYRVSSDEQKRRYNVGLGDNWMKPNSTDVHSVKHMKDLAFYMSKEFTKNMPSGPGSKILPMSSIQYIWNSFDTSDFYNGNLYLKDRQIGGRLWGLSFVLSSLRSAQMELTNELDDEIWEIEKVHPERVRRGDYYKCVYVNISSWINFTGDELFKVLCKYLLRFGYDLSLD